jgi:hypothetical protein
MCELNSQTNAFMQSAPHVCIEHPIKDLNQTQCERSVLFTTTAMALSRMCAALRHAIMLCRPSEPAYRKSWRSARLTWRQRRQHWQQCAQVGRDQHATGVGVVGKGLACWKGLKEGQRRMASSRTVRAGGYLDSTGKRARTDMQRHMASDGSYSRRQVGRDPQAPGGLSAPG